MAPRPVIGVSAAFERAAWTVWDDIEVNVSQRTYSERIDAADGDFEEARPYLETLGSIASGGKADGDRIESRVAVSLK